MAAGKHQHVYDNAGSQHPDVRIAQEFDESKIIAQEKDSEKLMKSYVSILEIEEAKVCESPPAVTRLAVYCWPQV